MPTYTALTTLHDKVAADTLGLALEELDPAPTGIGVFEIEDGSETWEVGGYFLERPDDVALALLAAGFKARPFVVSEVPDKDWVAEVRRELSPVRAGRFFVYGSHDADKVPNDVTPLLIDAAMAFGTGHHGTTQGCLTALDKLAAEGSQFKNPIDLGCGTAVLAMGAAHLWPCDVWASDIDEIATETSSANIKTNGLADRIKIVTCAGFDHPDLRQAAPFDLVIANILKGPLIDLAPDMLQMTTQDAVLVLSGILVSQAEETVQAFVPFGFEQIDRLDIGEWTSLTLKKQNAA